MGSPFEVLGLKPSADENEVRAAYRALAKKYHPDMYTDPQAQAEAQARFIELNQAYSEALRLAPKAGQAKPLYRQPLPLDDSLTLAARWLERDKPESALRELKRAQTRSARWYELYGKTLMLLYRYEEAHEAFREAVRQCPDNNDFRACALEAAVAMKRDRTLGGKLARVVRSIRGNGK